MKQFAFITFAVLLLLQNVLCQKELAFDFFKVKLHGENNVAKRLTYPEVMEKFTFSNMDNLEITLKLVEKDNSEKTISNIEQAMVYLSNEKSQNSFVLEALNDGKYRISLKDLTLDNNEYSLIARFSSPSNDYIPLEYTFGNVDVKYTVAEKKVDPNKAPTLLESEGPNFYPKPDQPHIFKPEPKQKSKLFAKFVFVLMLVPWAFLIFTWSKIGININGLFYNNKTLIYGVLFILSLCSIITILVLFFIKLNLFQTLGALGIASIYTSILGHLVLRQKADKRSSERKNKSAKKEKDTKSN
ncbi:hypothetical protein BCR36DRAFT_366652 [Piromyces finnis]|uniref:Ribophorin II C-terminal domain-containing protein n=1 Tax=Piromyces finnis TaxID=1754191 RepID=A0A1Y1VL02_9FUNG|nr:hypothetical protein BCR36DRAFT_366652 [Piromyces finnis]|eukprot:ORX58439.1 hypothetical protein BCR36DRAFT_366652 [Piromyces finnis]